VLLFYLGLGDVAAICVFLSIKVQFLANGFSGDVGDEFIFAQAGCGAIKGIPAIVEGAVCFYLVWVAELIFRMFLRHCVVIVCEVQCVPVG
jgi:hypothetical protein